MEIITKRPCHISFNSNNLIKTQPTVNVLRSSDLHAVKAGDVMYVDKINKIGNYYEVQESATRKIWYIDTSSDIQLVNVTPYVEIKNNKFHPDFKDFFISHCKPNVNATLLIVSGENIIKGMIADNDIKVPLSCYQFTALASFVVDCGEAILLNSLLLKKINNKDFEGASREFGRWVNEDGRKVKRKVLLREAEAKFFLIGD